MQALKPSDEVDFSRRYTLEEFWALPEREDHAYYELIKGYLFMVPPPNPPHGSIDSRLNKALVTFLAANNIDGDVHHPREPVFRRAEDSTYLEPDMMYVSPELRDRMGVKRTSADIVFEYVSRRTSAYDRTTKANAYLDLDVRELWLVDPFTETVGVRHPTKVGETRVWEISKYSRGEHAKSRVLAGWEVSVDELFKDIV
ncbi:MAG TPA: Uma2 family endonuclease [Pyrinomonadaceae bacterium]|nr:Uma2 family endonuclease [Pyrinomonadaceae bacterium]